jgi:hypothetical protein
MGSKGSKGSFIACGKTSKKEKENNLVSKVKQEVSTSSELRQLLPSKKKQFMILRSSTLPRQNLQTIPT